MARDDVETIINLIRVFGPLSVEEIKTYFMKVRGDDPERINVLLGNMGRKNQIMIENDVIRLFPGEPMDKKILVAFWVFIAFADKAGDRFFKARYPAQIGFTTDNGVYLITVCDDKYHDKEMIALREKEEEYAENIIVGINLDAGDLHENIRPRKSFAYARYDASNLIKDIPKIKFEKVSVES